MANTNRTTEVVNEQLSPNTKPTQQTAGSGHLDRLGTVPGLCGVAGCGVARVAPVGIVGVGLMSKYRTVRRVVLVPCPDCFGTGLETGGKCRTCKGRGDVERIVNEIVAEDEVKTS